MQIGIPGRKTGDVLKKIAYGPGGGQSMRTRRTLLGVTGGGLWRREEKKGGTKGERAEGMDVDSPGRNR